MSKAKKKSRHLKLPKTIREELALQHLTYEEAIKGCDQPPPHDLLLQSLRTWRKLTLKQKAAWEDAARQYNLSGGDPAATN